MWALTNNTPYAADRAFVRDRDGAEIWIVAVRATFDILPNGKVELAKEQIPVALAPEWTGEPGKSSMRWDSDLVRTKPGTDVILNAEAHAPGGKPVTRVEVGFGIGTFTKQLVVHGDREYRAGLLGTHLTDAKPFLTMPIRYERAHGGQLVDDKSGQLKKQVAANPIGCGMRRQAGDKHPNVEHPSGLFGDSRPAGFGAIPPHWHPRVGLAGTYDKKWEETRQPLLPEDFDDNHFHCAPEDQRAPGHLKGGEPVVLANLSSEPLIRFSLPKVRLGFRTSIDGGSVHHRANLYTVILEPSERRLVMVWQTALPCHHTLYTLKRTTVFEKAWLDREDVPSHAAGVSR